MAVDGLHATLKVILIPILWRIDLLFIEKRAFIEASINPSPNSRKYPLMHPSKLPKSERISKAMIEALEATGLTESQTHGVLELFNYAFLSMSRTLARESIYDTSDFGTAAKSCLSGFALHVRKEKVLGVDMWHGIFVRGEQTLYALATVEVS